MLETLSSYQVTDARGHPIGPQIGGRLDPRFPVIVIFTVWGHALFFAALLTLSWWSMKTIHRRPLLSPDDKVTMINVGASHLRLPPEPPERVDTSQLSLDSQSDDTHLMARSPNPGFSHGMGKNQLPTGAKDQSAGHSQDAKKASDAMLAPKKDLAPPRSDQFPINQATPLDRTQTLGLGTGKPVAPPPPPPTTQKDIPGTAPTGKKAEDSGAARQFAYRASESQYRAYVRSKIYKENERIMPRQYIESVLAAEVSAEFSISVTQGGRLKAVRLVRSCGYRALDDLARQAIYVAAPFEGFPPEASDPLELDVTVHYTPFK